MRGNLVWMLKGGGGMNPVMQAIIFAGVLFSGTGWDGERGRGRHPSKAWEWTNTTRSWRYPKIRRHRQGRRPWSGKRRSAAGMCGIR